MAEVHIIGSIMGASGFPSANLSCKWSMVAGEEWTLLEGSVKGHTQVDLPVVCIITLCIIPYLYHLFNLYTDKSSNEKKRENL